MRLLTDVQALIGKQIWLLDAVLLELRVSAFAGVPASGRGNLPEYPVRRMSRRRSFQVSQLGVSSVAATDQGSKTKESAANPNNANP